MPKLMMPFRFHAGGYLGDGRQWISWISLRDEIRAIRFLIDRASCSGAFNLTAPRPVTMRQLCKALGDVLGRSSWTKVPGFAVRLALGEMADEMLLTGQKVLPNRLTDAGFEFQDTNVKEALKTML